MQDFSGSNGAGGASRRNFLQTAVVGATAGLLLGSGRQAQAEDADKPKNTSVNNANTEPEVTPTEDLMREHGLLKRVILVYAEGIRRIDAKEDLPPDTIMESAKIIRSFIEDYHEKLEEEFLFPRFRKAKLLVETVDVLKQQHDAGRAVTDVTLQLATAQALKNEQDRTRLVESLRRFNRMYNPHEAREDTIVFPALHKIVTQHEFDALGDDFEKREHQLFGEDGFEKMVDKVAGIEKQLGIYELAQFTPKAP